MRNRFPSGTRSCSFQILTMDQRLGFSVKKASPLAPQPAK